MNIELGKQGEEIAAKYLQQEGYKIISRNYRSRYGELDIICTHNQTMVFVEVKTRKSTNFGSPEESITRSKKEHIRKVALIYLESNPQPFREIRFDVIGILVEGKSHRINHLRAAF